MDHGKNSLSDALAGVAAQLKADDGSFRAAIVVRDKQRPYDEPTVIRTMTVQEISDFVTGIADQVHYLVLSHGESNGFVKISLSAKTGSYNVFCGKVSKLAKQLDKEILDVITPELPEALQAGWSSFLYPSEEE